MSWDYDYLTVGHVTLDAIDDAPDGPRLQPGGGAFYSALQASRLGLRALIVTSGAAGEIERLLAPFRSELDVEVLPAAHTTTLATRGAGAGRRQRVRAWAGPIERAPAARAAIVHFAPVAREITARTRDAWAGVAAGARFVGLTPQGLVRRWGDDGWIARGPLDAAALPERLDAAVLNRGERASCAALLGAGGPADGAVIAVTAGQAAIELRLPHGGALRVAPVPAGELRDELGAGDVFAAAFFVALARGEPAQRAARFASAAASARMRAPGPAAVATGGAIEALL